MSDETPENENPDLGWPKHDRTETGDRSLRFGNRALPSTRCGSKNGQDCCASAGTIWLSAKATAVWQQALLAGGATFPRSVLWTDRAARTVLRRPTGLVRVASKAQIDAAHTMMLTIKEAARRARV
jgi:hypothetical protein